MSKIRKKHHKNNAPKIISIIIAILLVFFIFNAVVGSSLIMIGTKIVTDFYSELPDIKDFSPIENALTSKIYASDGTLIGTLYGEENRELVPLSEIPKNMINAVIAIEDERYYEHKGVDLEAFFRALLVNLKICMLPCDYTVSARIYSSIMRC